MGTDGTGLLTGNCNNGSENSTFTGALTHDPGFLADTLPLTPLQVLYLAPDSQNIDTCDDSLPSNPGFDLIGQLRLVDITEVANQAGLLDRGAIERHPPLFADGFEV